MSTPRSAGQQHETRHIRQFLSKLYGDQLGWMEVCYINGDPLVDDCKRARWIYYTPERLAEIATYLAQLARRYGNAYVSSTLYRIKQRSRKVALPSRIVFIDDAPERSDYSMVVRTSESSRHAYYILEQPVDAGTRADLQRRATYAFKADASGADVEQIVRIPNSINTKRGGHYAVHLERLSNRTHTVEQLRRRWPEVVHLDSDPADIDWQAVERWLGNRDLIFNPAGMPWRFTNPEGQGRKLLEGKLTPLKPDGTYDPSLARAILIKSCILHGYEDAPTAAIAIEKANFGQTSTKATKDIKADIARLIGKYRKAYPNIKPTPIGVYPAKTAQPLPKVLHKSRARKDRPHKIDATGLLAWYTRRIDAGGTVLMTRAEAAKELKISIPTLDRLERQLRERGLLERRTSKDRRRSWVAILGAINIAQATAQNAPDPVLSASAETAHQDAENSTAEACIKEHAPPKVPVASAPRPSVSQAVNAMRRAGATRRRGDKNLYRMLDAYFADHGWSHAEIGRAYDDQRQAEQRRRLLDRVNSMTTKELCRAIDSAERHIATSHKREDDSWRFWLVYRNRCHRRLKHLHAKDSLIAGVCFTKPPPKVVQPACLEMLRRLLADPVHIPAVERYMQKYPGFDYGDVLRRIVVLKGQVQS